MLLIMCIALAWAIQGAVSQAWSDGRAGVAATGHRARSAVAARAANIRENGGRPSRAALAAGTGIGVTARGLWRVGAGTGRSLATGAREGWQRGQEKGRERAQKAAERKEQRRAAKAARCVKCQHGTEENPYRTDCPCPIEACRCVDEERNPKLAAWKRAGRCGECEHLYREGRVDGCGCGNERCPCTVRGEAAGGDDAEPTTTSDPGIPTPAVDEDAARVPLTKTGPQPVPAPPAPALAGGSLNGAGGVAVLERPTVNGATRPAPAEPATTEDNPQIEAIPAGGDTMPVTTGEATGITQTRDAIGSFTASATTYLDTAQQAQAEAATARGEADALVLAAEQMRASMADNEVDSDTLGEIASMQEQASALAAAAAELERAAGAVGNAADGLSASSKSALAGVNSRHSTLEEAHKSAPEGGAKKNWYLN